MFAQLPPDLERALRDLSSPDLGTRAEGLSWEASSPRGALEPLCILWCIPVFTKGQATHAFKLLTA